MVREFLWAGKGCDLNYVANDGNINLTTGAKGTIACWLNTKWDGANPGGVSPGIAYLFRAYVDSDNYMTISFERGVGGLRYIVRATGVGTREVFHDLDATNWPADTWKHVVATWDWTGGAGSGVMRLYVDGAEVGTAITDAGPLASAPSTFAVGNTPSNATYGLKGFMDDFAIWDDVMTQPQAAALYNAGRRHRLQESDGTGNLTFLCRFDGRYDADVATGTAAASITDATEIGRIPDGAIERYVRSRFRFGSDSGRINPNFLFYDKNEQQMWPFTCNADHAELVTAGTSTRYYLREILDTTTQPFIFKLKFWVGNLADGEYFRFGRCYEFLRIYNDRIQEDSDTGRSIPVKMGESYRDNTKWVDLWVVRHPLGAGGGTWIMVNRMGMMKAATVGWTSTSYPLEFNFDAAYMPTSEITLKIESIEVYGPGQYQICDDPQDMFLMPENGKIWRLSNLIKQSQAPTKYENNPLFTQEDYEWSYDERMPLQVETTEEGTYRIRWDAHNSNTDETKLYYLDSSDGLTWIENPNNPVMDLDALRGTEGDWDHADAFWLYAHLPLRDPEGNLVMPYGAANDPDGSSVGLLIGAPDEYSFNSSHKYEGNPILRPYGDGCDGYWYNRDVAMYIRKNVDPSPDNRDLYLAYGRGKTEWESTPYACEERQIISFESPDLKVWKPRGETLIPIPGCADAENITWFQSHGMVIAAINHKFTNGIRLIASEDGIIFSEIFASFLKSGTQTWESADGKEIWARGVLHVGDQWYWYYSSHNPTPYDQGIGVAISRYGGLTWYELSPGETEGTLETCVFTKPADGWGRLTVNADRLTATEYLTVELVDAETEEPITGFSDADCNPLTEDSTAAEVTWGSAVLAGVPNAFLRVRFTLRRASAESDSPRLFGYKFTPAQPPVVSDVRIEGQINPSGISDSTPLISWTFTDPHGLGQSAYRIGISSSHEKLNAGDYNVWDSGEVESQATAAEYGGETPLQSNHIYYVKVFARNAAGAWSS